jgi:hypothetical protein
LQNWATAASASRSFQRDMFYAWLIPQEVVQAEIARNRSGI